MKSPLMAKCIKHNVRMKGKCSLQWVCTATPALLNHPRKCTSHHCNALLMTNALLTTSLPGVAKVKIQQNFKISFCKIMKHKLFYVKVLPKKFSKLRTTLQNCINHSKGKRAQVRSLPGNPDCSFFIFERWIQLALLATSGSQRINLLSPNINKHFLLTTPWYFVWY